MISYELAKELKDAGWPQNSGRYISETNRRGAWGSADGIEEFDAKIGGHEHWAYVPTLGELIEACGEWFGGLSNFGGDIGWRAYTKSASPNVEDRDWKQEDGATPDIAVARLWLALNPKV